MKLAVFTPLNPIRSGVSDYSEALLPKLADHVDATVFIDDGYEPDGFPGDEKLQIRNWREWRPEEFDETLFQFANNPFHVYAWEASQRHRGALLLHEFNLHHLLAAATIVKRDWEGYLREVEYEGGAAALAYARRVKGLEVGPDYEGLPLSRRILEGGKAAIVHSRFMEERIRSSGVEIPVRRIPHGAWIPKTNRHASRAQLGLDETQPLIGIFGFLKPYKRIRQSLEAMRRLVRVEPRARMILVGEEHPELPVRRMIDDFGLGDHVRVLGFAPIEEFVEWIDAADICLNLRYPTAGETSGTLLRALGLGKAVVVSHIGAFADLPEEVCLRVPVDGSETDLLFEYLNLLVSRPEVRKSLGERARKYVESECSWEHVAKQMAEYLERVHEGRPEPEPAPPPAAAEPEPPPPAPPSQPPAERSSYADYIRGFSSDPSGSSYLETHLSRLVRTLQLTPLGGPDDSVLEMGAYMHITPALQTKLGYGEVRGCYLGPRGRTDTRRVTSASGEVFECEVDLFDAENDCYPYPDGRFTTVLCCELLEHLYDDPMHLMAEVNRILRMDGRLVLTTPNICSLRAVGAILLGYHPGLFHQYVRPDANGERDPRHAREYAPRDVEALFEAAGFEVEKLETGPYLEQPSLEHEWVKHLLARYELPLDRRGECIYAVGRKAGPMRERHPPALYVGGTA